MTTLDYLVIPQPDIGNDQGPTVTVRFATKLDEVVVLRRHWDKTWQTCEGKHCQWCLQGERILQRYDAVVESDGRYHNLQMNLNLYRQIRKWADHLKDDFNHTSFNIRRRGQGVSTEYEVFQ